MDDFEDGDANGWKEVSGTWQVQDGMYVMMEKDEGTQDVPRSIIQSPWNFSDGTIELTINFEKRGASTEIPTVLYRMVDDNNGYAFRMGNDRLEVGRFVEGAWENIRGDAAVINTDKPCQIKLIVEGIFTKIYYNGEIKARIGDLSDTFKAGKVGLAVFDSTEPVYFDNITISGDGIAPFREMRPVEPAGKLTSVWGKIKEY
jgi:hypothetical protein